MEATAATATGPLPDPVLRAPEVLQEFLTATADGRNGGQHLARGRLLATPEGVAAASLVMELIQRGALGGDAALTILHHASISVSPLLAIDALRIGAVLWPRRGEATADDLAWARGIAYAARGLLRREHDLRLPLACTHAELASLAAVTHFVLVFQNSPDEDHDDLTDSGVNRVGGAPWAMVANRHLEALLRERPEDLDRIVAHCRERGLDSGGAEAVDLLRESLDMGASALDSGWL